MYFNFSKQIENILFVINKISELFSTFMRLTTTDLKPDTA